MLSISDTKIMNLTNAFLFFVTLNTMETSEVMLVVCSRSNSIGARDLGEHVHELQRNGNRKQT